MTAGELARRLGLELRGEPGREVGSAAPLESAGPADLAFAASVKFFDAARASGAGCVIALPEFTGSDGQAVLVSTQPRAHFAEALSILYPSRPVEAGWHPTAVVENGALVHGTAEIGPHAVIERGAVIGANVCVGPGSCVGQGAVIGEDSVLHGRVTIYPGVRIGKRCMLHAGAVIGADGFGFEMQGGRFRKVPQVGMVEIGDDVEIGANSCVDRAALGKTVVGEGSKLDNLVHIAHNCQLGKHVVIAAQTGLAGGVTVGDYAVIGGQVGVGDKARIESRAVVGSGAGILTSKIVRAGEPVWGTPARPLRQYLAQLAVVSRLAMRQRGPRAKHSADA